MQRNFSYEVSTGWGQVTASSAKTSERNTEQGSSSAHRHKRTGNRMDLYAASNNFHFGTIVELDRFHEFPDGSIRPGALIKPTNAFRVWIPVEKLTNALVVQ